jgi:hypothetical protein
LIVKKTDHLKTEFSDAGLLNPLAKESMIAGK